MKQSDRIIWMVGQDRCLYDVSYNDVIYNTTPYSGNDYDYFDCIYFPPSDTYQIFLEWRQKFCTCWYRKEENIDKNTYLKFQSLALCLLKMYFISLKLHFFNSLSGNNNAFFLWWLHKYSGKRDWEICIFSSFPS